MAERVIVPLSTELSPLAAELAQFSGVSISALIIPAERPPSTYSAVKDNGNAPVFN